MAVTKQEKRIRKLYGDLKKKDKHVGRLYGDLPPEDPLLRHGSAYGNTFLHMAIRFGQLELVSLLLGKLKEHKYEDSLPTVKNNDGDTILHGMAANDDLIDAAKKVVGKDSKLLIALNNFGETPIFCAVRQGQTAMFRFLGGELEGKYPDDVKKHLQREDKTTILHVAVTTEQFKLAYSIAKRFPSLIGETDQDGMIVLQYLACNQEACERIRKETSVPISFEDYGLKRRKGQPFMVRFKELFLAEEPYQSTRYALKSLVTILVEEDNTWLTSINPQIIGTSQTMEMSHEMNIQEPPRSNLSEKEIVVGRKEIVELQENEGGQYSKFRKNNESPLFLAIMSNTPEIVEEIFLHHPEAIQHVNKDGMNVLQVAVLYGNIEIIELILQFKMLPKSLLSATEDEGNSLLHMVGSNKRRQAKEKAQNPAVQLRNECMLFQKVKAACSTHIIKPLNDHHQTAEELFAARNQKLHQEAMEWLMCTTQNCTILSVFIATVAFAAVYTVPGGPNQNTGIPLFSSNPWFVVFVTADVLSLTLALGSVAMFTNVLTSSFPLEDFETYGLGRLISGIGYMGLSIIMVAVAFASTIVLVLTTSTQGSFGAVIGFLPAFVFILLYSPLHLVALAHAPEWMINLIYPGREKHDHWTKDGKNSNPQPSQPCQV